MMTAKFPTALLMLWVLGSCGESQSGNYANWDALNKAQLVEKGWVPSIVPRSATNIFESHDLDSNTQWVEFSVPRQGVIEMIRDLPIVPKMDVDIAMANANVSSWGAGKATGLRGYIVCEDVQPGVLFVDLETGSALFSAPADWARDDCENK